MKLTNQQACLLVSILQDTLTKNVVGYLCTSQDDRAALLNQILNQQDRTLVELDTKKDDEKKDGDD